MVHALRGRSQSGTKNDQAVWVAVKDVLLPVPAGSLHDWLKCQFSPWLAMDVTARHSQQ